ncbi:DAK2 domain-containing protein [Mycobacterium kansasii]|uniref:DAK2 domain protein n=1 Tax=Mycobacterium kansasii TaxID=1768 RepID=A0A653EWM5_MYCKA|nr:DAK2 domain-containing protein [Mycobacterium kansasii]EUA05665.1 DAK2 domain fusion YloV family protein [Mycobacterium kansasii 824]ARG64732.1 dihydroxyacetone kinase [Mycobacterium kansasii]ARG72506.1 dihydroxyacetone kinase [Mycobacterium kansasii]ARG78481.1 dihydroxyacetone kinase [Mycobacterium kansasii]KEP43038.1 dihydroxyacetone kinase [Mycobacterium kansasii]
MGTSGRLLDASALRDWAHIVVSDLITHIDEINRLNVFPVADADTGANMLFTMRAALAEADAVGAASVARVAAALSSGAHNGARGNSGVIVSQILRGIADVTAEAAADGALPAIDAVLLAAALWRGVELVIASMGGAEVPGTIVSVLRAAAAAVEQCAGTGETLAQAVTAAGDAAVVALEKTPEQLAVLADAGVVDAGGRGLVVMLDALRSTLTGHTPTRSVYEPAPRPLLAEAPARPAPQFEVMYLLTGCDAAAADTLRDRLAELGDSVAIAAAPSQSYSVHVHTDDAGAAVEAGLTAGQLSRIVISALSSGANGLPAGSWTRERAVLAVVDGDGAAELFAGEGACVLRPGPDASPGSAPAADISAHQLVRAVVDTGAAQVMVLPNGYVAVEELVAGCTAALGWGVDVVPVPTGSMVQGLAALAVHDPASQAVDDGYTMARAAGAARHGSVRTATQRALTWAGTCEPGDGLGIAGDEVLIVARDVAGAAIGLLDLLLASGGDLVTVLVGAGIDDEDAAVLSDLLDKHMHDRHPGTELVTYRTGHRGDALLIGVE